LKVWCRACAVLCLATLVGCGREAPAPAEAPVAVVTVTNVVETVREVAVTNTVTLTVTNVVIEKREPPRILSKRKTAPYAAFTCALDAQQLRQALSHSGARVIECQEGAIALVEASDKAIASVATVVNVKPLVAAEKIAADAGENVRIVPLSSIDTAEIAQAVRDLGGSVGQVVAVGKPAVRAKISYQKIRKLAERGDVRRIERDEGK